MNEPFSPTKWSARNPLGVVALFISLIYGMSALLLGTAVTHLTNFNQTILVGFVVVFPFVVLAVFAWLVAKHHRKLYGPSDYRSDEGFLSAQAPLSPAEFHERIEATVDREEPSNPEQTAGGGQRSNSQAETDEDAKDIARHSRDRTELAARAYLAEGLVLHELQAEFGGSIKREVAVGPRGGPRLILDGLIQTAKDQMFVEVKLARSPSSLARMLSNVATQFWRYRQALEASDFKDIRFLLAVVLDENLSRPYAEEIVQKYRSAVGDDVIVKIYPLSDLLKKYRLK